MAFFFIITYFLVFISKRMHTSSQRKVNDHAQRLNICLMIVLQFLQGGGAHTEYLNSLIIDNNIKRKQYIYHWIVFITDHCFSGPPNNITQSRLNNCVQNLGGKNINITGDVSPPLKVTYICHSKISQTNVSDSVD